MFKDNCSIFSPVFSKKVASLFSGRLANKAKIGSSVEIYSKLVLNVTSTKLFSFRLNFFLLDHIKISKEIKSVVLLDIEIFKN